jgi:hypothetical protein
VDAHAFYHCQNKIPPRLFQKIVDIGSSENKDDNDTHEDMGSSTKDHKDEHTEDDTDENREKEPSEEKDSKRGERKEDFRALTDEERLVTFPLVKGFDLKAKEWCIYINIKHTITIHRIIANLLLGQLNVSEVRDLVWNETPYENLVLEDKVKGLLMAFADHQAHRTGFDDFVQHKGRKSPL